MFISFSQYKLIIFIWIALAVGIFFLLRRITAPYGRHTSANWGLLIDNQLGWLLMELPALLIMGFFFTRSLGTKSYIVALMIGLYCLHYFNRTVVFPFRLHTKGKKIPLVIVVSGIFFNLTNTFFLGYYFTHFVQYGNDWLSDWRFIGGIILFITGLIINWMADDMLINLRKPDETHYSVPKGWLFEFVSCPNMLGELIEWGGFALLCWNLPALAFFIWSAANLLPRALSHHRWYKDKFLDYPDKRKAIVPFIV